MTSPKIALQLLDKNKTFITVQQCHNEHFRLSCLLAL